MKNTFMRYTFHYISILLNYLASIYCNPWDNGVYKGFTHMCDDTFFPEDNGTYNLFYMYIER